MASVKEVEERKTKATDEPFKCLWSTFKVMREEKEFTDVDLVCDRGGFQAHQIVLAAQSPYFRKMFLNNFKESTTRQVDFSHINKDTMLLILDYIYLNSVENISDQNVESLINIFQISHLFEIEGLMKSCWELILNRINAENWFNVWELVLLHGNHEDTVKVLQFILDNLSEIVENNFFLLNYSQLMELLEKMNENNLRMEEKFLEAIIQWNKNTKEEKFDLETIFLKINCNFISFEFMYSLLNNETDLFPDSFLKLFKQYILPKLKTCSEIEFLKKRFSLTVTETKKLPLKLFFFRFCKQKTRHNDRSKYESLKIFDCDKQSPPTIIHNLPFRFGYDIFPVQYHSDIYIIGSDPNNVPELKKSGVKHFFLYDWKKNAIIVKPSLIEEVRFPVTCVTEENIYVVGCVEEPTSRKTVVQYFSLTENKWFAQFCPYINSTACVAINDVTYLLCPTPNEKCRLYTVEQLNCQFHSYLPAQSSFSVYQRSVTTYKEKIFILSYSYEWCIFHHYSQHWTIGSVSIPSAINLNYVHIFSNANNSLMLYNEKEQSLYQFDENNSDIKKVMTLEKNDLFDSQDYLKYETLFVFQSSNVLQFLKNFKQFPFLNTNDF